MKNIVLIFIIVITAFLFSTCDLINPATINQIILSSNRDNPLDLNYWEVLSDYGEISGRGNPVTFTIGDKIYFGLGDNFESSLKKDFWVFDVDAKIWTQLNDFPGNGKRSAVSFVIGDFAYIVGGSDVFSDSWVDSNVCWKYDSSIDEWSRIADLPAYDKDGEHWPIYWSWPVSAKVVSGKAWLMIAEKGILTYDPVADSWSDDEPSQFWNHDHSRSISFSEGGLSYHLLWEKEHSSGIEMGVYSYDVETKIKTEVARFEKPLISDGGDRFTFIYNNRVYIFTQMTGAEEDSLISFPANAAGGSDDGLLHGNPGSGGWIEDGVNGNYYPMVSEDFIYFFLPDGDFYRYKP